MNACDCRVIAIAVALFTLTFSEAAAKELVQPGGPCSCVTVAPLKHQSPYSGEPTHISRAKTEIGVLQQETFQETRRMLRSAEQYVTPLLSERLACPSHGFERVLATRRSLKFVADLERLPLGERIEVLETEMASLADSYLKATRTLAAWYEDRSGPENVTDLYGVKCAMLTMLFAAAHATDEQTLVSLLKQSEELSVGVRKLCDASPAIPLGARHVVFDNMAPSREDLVNLVLHCRRRSNGFAEAPSVKIPESVGKGIVQMGPWDAPRELWHLIGVARGASDDAAHGVEAVEVYGFCASATSTDDRRRHEQAIEAFDDALSAIDFDAICHE
jgi:hypothetical protein